MILKELFMFKIHATPLRLLSYLVVGLSGILSARTMHASDHLDTPTVIADPAADIGDLFAWTSSDGRRLNLVMDIVAHQFSNKLQYVFHVDSGKAFGKTTKSITILCQFDIRSTVECWAGNVDCVQGNAGSPAGLESEKHHFRVFAGLRDDPFFNNVKGTRAAYNIAGAALQNGAQVDSEQCPVLDVKTSQEILRTWRSTDGGPARNFLAGWKTSALVVSIDLDVVSTGGRMLAVWGTVHKQIAAGQTTQRTMPKLGEQIERTARPLIKNALVGGPLAPDSISDQRKEAYNRAARSEWGRFASDIERTLGLYDGFDGQCGNQWIAKPGSARRYAVLSRLLADDRIWINSSSSQCTQFLAVEFTALGSPGASPSDCGGRTPNYDASNIFRSLLANGIVSGFDDGLHQDDKVHSTVEFPFLAEPL
jgi:hypothetical protein